MNSKKAIKETAKRNGVSEQYVRNEIQYAIDEAWNTTDEDALKRQKELFPNGKPSIEEFFRIMSQQVSGRKKSRGKQEGFYET